MNPYQPPDEADEPSPPDDGASLSTDELYPRALGDVAWLGGVTGWLVWSVVTKYWNLSDMSDSLNYLIAAACITGGMLVMWLYLRLVYANRSVGLPFSALAPGLVVLAYFCVVAATRYPSVKQSVVGALFLTLLISLFDRLVLGKRRYARADRLRRKRIFHRRMHK